MPELREYQGMNNIINTNPSRRGDSKKTKGGGGSATKILKNFVPAGPEVNIYAIPFLDRVRETARQKRLAEELAAGGKNAKQIKAEQKKALLLLRQKERRQVQIDKGRNPNKKKNKRGRHAQLVDEWEELAKEERLFKKFRRGKISKERYEELLHQVVDENGGTKTKKLGPGSSSSSASGLDEDDNSSICSSESS